MLNRKHTLANYKSFHWLQLIIMKKDALNINAKIASWDEKTPLVYVILGNIE